MRFLPGAGPAGLEGAKRCAQRLALIAVILQWAGCVSPPTPVAVDPAPRVIEEERAAPADGVLARSERLLVYLPQEGDSLASIARRFLGSATRGWEIAEANEVAEVRAGSPLAVPLVPINPTGVRADRVQIVPVLCYHRIGAATSRMTLSPSSLEQQFEWLAANGYSVVRLHDLLEFIEGRRVLPPRAVVLTFDDGYESHHRLVLPLLQKFGFPATVFLYTDFVGGGDALTWAQMQDMVASGLVDIQSHSKTHANLNERLPDESDVKYRQRLETEVRVSRDLIERRLHQPVVSFAYPFGDANETVLELLDRHRYRAAVTVHPGGNPFYAQPLLLHRVMIFGNSSLEEFKGRLQTSRPLESALAPRNP